MGISERYKIKKPWSQRTVQWTKTFKYFSCHQICVQTVGNKLHCQTQMQDNFHKSRLNILGLGITWRIWNRYSRRQRSSSNGNNACIGTKIYIEMDYRYRLRNFWALRFGNISCWPILQKYYKGQERINLLLQDNRSWQSIQSNHHLKRRGSKR